jgi:hypothetical protein
MAGFQIWLHRTLFYASPGVKAFMQSNWGWPTVESVHFVGLTLLFGSIAVWDLRLLGMARRIPIPEFHRLVPFAVLGFAINVSSGSMFLMTEPNQYVYNPAFQFKMLLLGLAGLNVLLFYVTTFRRLEAAGAGVADPISARVAGAVSLICWTGVIICGRLITFYRPGPCNPGEALPFLLGCIPR